jgi:plastocyanin
MFKGVFGTLALLTAMSMAALAEPATQPDVVAATQPTTQPTFATGSAHGKVTWSGSITLDQPDFSRAVVYLSSDPLLDQLSAAPAMQTCAQKNKEFIPNFLVVSKGTLVEFPNWDHISHNVFSRSAAAPAFDLDRYPYGQSKSRTFDKVGVVQLFCNIHPWMRAIIFVTPNRFFARVGADGTFKIDQIPAGHYEISIWQERCAVQKRQIVISPGQDADADFALNEDRDAIIANDPPRHDAQYGVARGLDVKRERLNLPVVTDSHPAPTTDPSPN